MTDENNSYRMRHFGSCGHVVEYKSKRLFDKYSSPREVDGKLFMNPVVEEGDAKIVLVHPDRFCVCEGCIMVDIAIDKLENLKDDEKQHEELLKKKLEWLQSKLASGDKIEVCGNFTEGWDPEGKPDA